MNAPFRVEEVAARYLSLVEVAPLRPIEDDADYDRAVAVLDAVLEHGADDERHPLAGLAHVLGTLIEEYEEKTLPASKATGVDVLRFLMQQHGLRQSDLPELGSQGVVSELLAGKRELRTSHIRALSKRFGVAADVFL